MKWDHAADVVVVGYGAGGAAAAIAAADLGADALILEKQNMSGHTPSTRMSGGIVMTVNDVEAAVRYLGLCSGGMIPDETTRAWATEASGLMDWLRDLDPEMAWAHVGNGGEHEHLSGVMSVDNYRAGATAEREDFSHAPGGLLYGLLARAVENRSIRVLWDSAAERLIKNDAGRIVGVVASGGTRVHARCGVVLSSGGYEFDESAKRDFLRAYPIHFYGNPGNTGDGLRMAQEVGASLWHMNQMTGRAILSFPSEEGRLNFRPKLSPPGYVMVDRDGNRFVNEDEYSLHSFYYNMIPFDGQRGEYPRIPSYWIFDERRRQAGPLTITEMGLCSVGLYDWSYDNMKEIEAGWIHRGRTVSEAAAKAGARDPEAVQRAVATYNGACEAKEDSHFHRPSESLVPLDSPPFYCVELWPGGANTSGGPRRDGAARVLDVHGSPIPGLFAAGELGQAIGLLYPAGGANISDALSFGRIAARTALAAERP